MRIRRRARYPSPPFLPAISKPLFFVILIPHGVIDCVVHHLLLHVHDLCLPFKLHHDLLDLGQLQLKVGGG